MEKTSENNTVSTDKKILWLVFGVILLKLVLLPFAQTEDADAVTRTFLSSDWQRNPIWITNGVWVPFHFYLTGAILAIWNNLVYAPIVLNIFLSAITIIPFYYLVKREFNPNGAFIASCFLTISPIIFRNSMMNMSETPYLLLLTLVLNFLSKGFKSGNSTDFLLAGLFTTIGSGFRFEVWVFIPLFTLAIILKQGKINAVLFFLVSMLYPATDVVTHFIQDHYSLSGFFSNYPWNLHPDGYLTVPHLKDYLRRLWFIPFCWFISLGPFMAIITLKEMLFVRKGNRSFLWGGIMFWVFLFLTEVAAFKGSIVLHERFAATISLLSLPFVAGYFNELSSKKIRQAILSGLLTIGLTFVYNMEHITPLPRLSKQDGDKVARIIQHATTPESGIFIDFWDWENSYYLALESRLQLPSNSIYFINGDKRDKVPSEEINSLIKNHPRGIILLAKNSLAWQNAIITPAHLQFKCNNKLLNADVIFNNDEVEVWKYNSGS